MNVKIKWPLVIHTEGFQPVQHPDTMSQIYSKFVFPVPHLQSHDNELYPAENYVAADEYFGEPEHFLILSTVGRIITI